MNNSFSDEEVSWGSTEIYKSRQTCDALFTERYTQDLCRSLESSNMSQNISSEYSTAGSNAQSNTTDYCTASETVNTTTKPFDVEQNDSTELSQSSESSSIGMMSNDDVSFLQRIRKSEDTASSKCDYFKKNLPSVNEESIGILSESEMFGVTNLCESGINCLSTTDSRESSTETSSDDKANSFKQISNLDDSYDPGYLQRIKEINKFLKHASIHENSFDYEVNPNVQLQEDDKENIFEPSSNDTQEFDDTLEEMNRFLEQGPDYDSPERKNSFDSINLGRSPVKIISGSFLSCEKNIDKLQNKPAPAKEIKRMDKPAGNNLFKLPTHPVKLKITPQKRSPHLKNIVSPVAMYINSPVPVISRKLTPHHRQLPNMLFKNTGETPIRPTTSTGTIPAVISKSTGKNIVYQNPDVKLPSYMEKYMQRSKVVVHQQNQHRHINQSETELKLSECDLTNASVNGDTSVRIVKDAFVVRES